MITVAHLQKISGGRSRSPNLKHIANAFNMLASEYGVEHQDDIADFLAHVSVETGGFRNLVESMNYSTKALKAMFGRHRISLAQIEKFGRKSGQKANQVQLANILYGGSFGEKNLGNVRHGDGWKFRGSGPGQVTGRGNFARAQRLTGIDFLGNPDLMRAAFEGMEATLALWQAWGMNKYKGGSRASRKKWNGGSHGLAEYQAAYKRAMQLKLSVPIKATPVAIPEPAPRDEEVMAIVEDAAATDRISSEKILSAGTVAGGGLATVNEAVEKVAEAQSLIDTLLAVSPWAIIVCVGAYWFYRRHSKQQRARAKLEALAARNN